MAEWSVGLKLLISAYSGKKVEINREQFSFSNFAKPYYEGGLFDFIFKSEAFFDSQAFDAPPKGSTKGTLLQHHLNNLVFNIQTNLLSRSSSLSLLNEPTTSSIAKNLLIFHYRQNVRKQ